MAHVLTTPTKTTATTARPAEKVRCKCNHLAKRLTSRSEKNPGRVFYQCYKGRDDPETCKFFVWEDMIPGTESSVEPKLSGTSPVARYNASLAAKASPIPKAGNNARGSGVTTQGYTYTLPPGTSPLKPITSIPHPPHPNERLTTSSTDRQIPATPDEPLPDSQIPDLTIGAGWNSAKKRAMARKRREVIVRALSGRTSDESPPSSEESEEEISGPDAPAEEISGDDGQFAPESIEAFESVPLARMPAADGTRKSDDFDDDDADGIAWGQVDVDAIEARASQQATTTPRPLRDEMAGCVSRAPLDVIESRTPTSGTKFIDRLKAVTMDHPHADASSGSKKRKRDQSEHGDAGDPRSEVSVMDGTSTPSFVSACGTLTPPETERRHDLDAFSSAPDLQGPTCAIPGTRGLSSVNPANGATSVHPSLEALNKDLIRRDRKAAADEKSREMLRGRVKALEGRVRELEAELRRVKSGR